MPSNVGRIPQKWLCLDCNKMSLFTPLEMRSKHRTHCTHCGGIVFKRIGENVREQVKRITKAPRQPQNPKSEKRLARRDREATNNPVQIKLWHQRHKAQLAEKKRLERLAYPSTVEVSIIFPAAQPSHTQPDSATG